MWGTGKTSSSLSLPLLRPQPPSPGQWQHGAVVTAWEAASRNDALSLSCGCHPRGERVTRLGTVHCAPEDSRRCPSLSSPLSAIAWPELWLHSEGRDSGLSQGRGKTSGDFSHKQGLLASEADCFTQPQDRIWSESLEYLRLFWFCLFVLGLFFFFF